MSFLECTYCLEIQTDLTDEDYAVTRLEENRFIPEPKLTSPFYKISSKAREEETEG